MQGRSIAQKSMNTNHLRPQRTSEQTRSRREGRDKATFATACPAELSTLSSAGASPSRVYYRGEIRVLCAGILVADIFVPSLPSLPAAGELCATDDFLLDTGGCAANVATCLAPLDLGAAACGRVGNDVFGDLVLSDLESKGIDVSAVT